MKRTKRMDPYLISRQKWELRYVAIKINREGYPNNIWTNQHDVLAAIKAVGRSRKKVYNWLRKNC